MILIQSSALPMTNYEALNIIWLLNTNMLISKVLNNYDIYHIIIKEN